MPEVYQSKLMYARELSKITGLSAIEIRQLMASGELKHIITPGCTFPRTTLAWYEQYLERNNSEVKISEMVESLLETQKITKRGKK